ncbi:MAG: Quinoprotein glucose dehydrogenase precursor [Verrucomicrobiota bacterium]
MLPRPIRTASHAPVFVTALCLLLSFTLPRVRAAAEVVEMETDLHGAVGKLKPATRIAAPEIEPASEEGKLALSRMNLPAGLKASLWAAEPMLANPVAFAFDETGRIFVAETYRYGTSTLDIRAYMWTLEDDLANRNQEDFMASIRRNFGEAGVKELSIESERIRLLEDSDGDGQADKSTIYAENFRSPMDGVAAGVLPRRGEVWFTNIPSLWKLSGREKAETRTEVFRGFGVRFNYTGHDLHGLILGPDGRIYFSVGDRGAAVTTKEGRLISAPDTGSVFRCWPDGSGLELFATGLRNPQSLLFNEYGDLFTGDNDSDQGDQERLVHVVENGDSGWRVGYQHAPRGNAGPWNAEKLWHPRHAGQAAYLLPPICNIEDGPSGIAYYPGTGLTPAYAGMMFITHFKGAISNSGIYTYKVKPEGASYAIEAAAPFLTGALPTDVRFGPDGKLYYSDWAEGWPKSKRGRIYSIADPTRANDPLVKETKALIAGDWTKRSDAELAKLLAHADWRVRLEAQYTLAERGVSAIAALSQIAHESDGFARLHAVWALGMIARQHSQATDALRAVIAEASPEARAQATKTLGDLRDEQSAPRFVAQLSDSSARVRFFAAQALGKVKAANATPALIEALRANNDTDPYLRHALVMALVENATSEQLAALARHEAGAVRLAAVLALRRQQSPLITAFLTDTDAMIARETALAINDAPIPAAYPALAGRLGQSSDEAVQLRALNAHFRLGTAENAAALANFAASPAQAELRKEALALLTLWPAPPARDRIVGDFLPLDSKTRPTESVVQALLPKLGGILTAHTPDVVQVAAIEAVHSLKLTQTGPMLVTVVADPAQSASVRVAALKVLDQFDDAGLTAAAAAAAGSDSPELRLAALPVSSRLAPASAVSSLTKLADQGTPKEQQIAFRALGAAKDPAADTVILNHLGGLDTGKIAPAAQLDLLEAAAQRGDPRIKQFLADRDAALAKDPDPLAPYRVALVGGNAELGRKVFNTHPVMQCMRCHRLGNAGSGDAGPNLGGIGARASREYILESIIKPSAKIAPGFEIATVTKKNGEAIVGTILHRDAAGLQLKTGENEVTPIPASEIMKVESAPSAMPEIAALVLSKSEIRNLVETLASATEPLAPATGKAPLRAFQQLDAN